MKCRYIYEKGDNKFHSEDFLYVGLRDGILTAAVGDWASNLTGNLYEDRETAAALGHDASTRYNGGVIGAQTARRVIKSSKSTGADIVREINEALAAKYGDMSRKYDELKRFRDDKRVCFTGFLSHVVATPQEMVITNVGDVRAAVGDCIVSGKDTIVQKFLNGVRQLYIGLTNDTQGTYDVIRPLIYEQFRWQNGDRPLSAPVINGTATRADGINTLKIKTPENCGLLLFSDGYVVPEEFTIDGLERMLAHVYEVDPFRYKEFPAAGRAKDDRTAVEIHVDGWNELVAEKVTPENSAK